MLSRAVHLVSERLRVSREAVKIERSKRVGGKLSAEGLIIQRYVTWLEQIERELQEELVNRRAVDRAESGRAVS